MMITKNLNNLYNKKFSYKKFQAMKSYNKKKKRYWNFKKNIRY